MLPERNFHAGESADVPFRVRSGWERNFARILIYKQAEGGVKDFTYEPRRYEFPVKRGCIDYLPDFEVEFSFEIIPGHRKVLFEVKGQLDQRSRTKLKRFRKYHPQDWERLMFVVRFDAKGGGLLGKRTKKSTAHSWLVAQGVPPERIWFYDQLRRDYRGKVKWE